MNLRVQYGFPVSVKRFEPDIFDRQCIFVTHVEFATALGLADLNPIGGLVASSGETGDFTEGLKHGGKNRVALQPIVRQAFFAACQNMGSQVGDANPWQDQKAGVVDEQMQVALAALCRPADELIARCGLPGGGSKTEQRQRFVVGGTHQITHLRTGQRLVAEVVIALDKRIPDSTAGTRFDDLKVQRAHLPQVLRQFNLVS